MMLIVLKSNHWSINTKDHLRVIFDSGWLILLSRLLTTVTDNQDIIVGCWVALHSISWNGLLQMWTPLPVSVSCTVVFGSQAYMTPCLGITGQTNFPSPLTSVTVFFIVLHSFFAQLWWENEKPSSKLKRRRTGKLFTASSGEKVSHWKLSEQPFGLWILTLFRFNLVWPGVCSFQGIISHHILNMLQWQVQWDQ